MLTKKTATVAQALAPFKKVQANLAAVIETNTALKNSAREQAARLEQDAQAAQAEAAQAEKILAALAGIVGAA